MQSIGKVVALVNTGNVEFARVRVKGIAKNLAALRFFDIPNFGLAPGQEVRIEILPVRDAGAAGVAIEQTAADKTADMTEAVAEPEQPQAARAVA